MASEFYLNTPTAQLAPLGLIGMMGGIFMAWKIKRFEPFMRRWFLHRPVIFTTSARREWANCVTMFTSTVRRQFYKLQNTYFAIFRSLINHLRTSVLTLSPSSHSVLPR